MNHDTRTEKRIAQTLRGGILLSGGFMLAGFLLHVYGVLFSPFVGVIREGHFAEDMWHHSFIDLLQQPLTYIYLGILTLMFTPVVRVLLTIILFAHEGDRRYVLISSIVLVVVIASIVLSVTH